MHTPCNRCPFRVDDDLSLPKDKRRNIVKCLTSKEKSMGFPCHKTTQWKNGRRVLSEESPCAGAAILILNDLGHPTAYLLAAQQEGKIDLGSLYSIHPIFNSFSAFIEAGD